MRISLEIYMNKLGKNLEEVSVAEIGVYKGDNAVDMLEEVPKIKKLFLIDNFNVEDRWFTDSLGRKMSQEYRDEFVKNVEHRFSKYGERVALIKKSSEEAVKDFPDGSLDYCYIDGAHDYQNVKRDLHLWYPKVKNMGMLAGHDVHYPDVTQAIIEFSVMKKISVFYVGLVRNSQVPQEIDLNTYADWWLFKVPIHEPEKVIYRDLYGLHIITSEEYKSIYPNNVLL